MLGETTYKELKAVKATLRFQFAGGGHQATKRAVFLPVKLWGRQTRMRVYVLEQVETPLLISIKWMKECNLLHWPRAAVLLDGNRLTRAVVLEEVGSLQALDLSGNAAQKNIPELKIPKSLPSSGGFCGNITPATAEETLNPEQELGDSEKVVVSIIAKDEGYPTFIRLWKLAQDHPALAGADRQLLRKFCCEYSLVTHKGQGTDAPQRPKSASRKHLALHPRHFAALDSFFYEGSWFCIFLNLHTRHSLVKQYCGNPTAAEVTNWLREIEDLGFLTECLLMDRGPEFLNSSVLSLCLQKNIHAHYSDGESHWTNGSIERRIRTLKGCATRLRGKAGLRKKGAETARIIVQYSCGAINRYPTKCLNGRTPLEAEKSVSRSTAFPDIESGDQHQHAGDNLQELATIALAEAALDPKLREAVRNVYPVRFKTVREFTPGQTVDIKTRDGWQGPCTVIGIDGGYVVRTQAGQYVVRQFNMLRLHATIHDLDIPASMIEIGSLKELEEILTPKRRPIIKVPPGHAKSAETFLEVDEDGIDMNIVSSEDTDTFSECSTDVPSDTSDGESSEDEEDPTNEEDARVFAAVMEHIRKPGLKHRERIRRATDAAAMLNMKPLEDPLAVEESTASKVATIARQVMNSHRLVVTKDMPLWGLVNDMLPKSRQAVMIKINKQCRVARVDSRWAEKFDVILFRVRDGAEEGGEQVPDGTPLDQDDLVVSVAVLPDGIHARSECLGDILLDPAVAKTGIVDISWPTVQKLGITGPMTAAIIAEVDCIMSNRVLDFVPLTSTGSEKVVSSKLILSLKLDVVTGRVKRCKCRWVVRGFADQRQDLKTEALTMKGVSLRFLLAAASSHKWDIHSFDFLTAFLQSDEYTDAKDRILISIPGIISGKFGVPAGCAGRLRKSLYGLKDAPAEWQKKLFAVLRSLGLRQLQSDPCVWVWCPDSPHQSPEKPSDDGFERVATESRYYYPELHGRIGAVFGCHVDDSVVAGCSEFWSTIWPKFESLIQIGSHEQGCFTFCGKRIVQNSDKSVTISQSHYLEKLEPMTVDGPAEQHLPAPPAGGKCPFRARIGCLLWMLQSRSDFAFELSELSSRVSSPTWGDVARLNELIESIRKRDVPLLTIPVLNWSKCQLFVFCDSSFQNRQDKRTQMGVVAYLGNLDGRKAKAFPIFWKSGTQQRKSHSTPGSELLALRAGCDTAKYLGGFLVELGCCTNAKCCPWVLSDSRDVVSLCATRREPKEANLIGDYHQAREDAAAGHLKICHVSNVFQYADHLTKRDGDINIWLESVRSSTIDLSTAAPVSPSSSVCSRSYIK